MKLNADLKLYKDVLKLITDHERDTVSDIRFAGDLAHDLIRLIELHLQDKIVDTSLTREIPRDGN
jgi:hypothetical protein